MSGTEAQPYAGFGAYVRSQRLLARLTLRQAAELARISNPYLSQIENDLAQPSIAVINALADALSVSVEAMLLIAAGRPRGCADREPTTEASIRQDPRLTDVQKRVLLAVLDSYIREPEPPAAPRHSASADQPPIPPAPEKEEVHHNV